MDTSERSRKKLLVMVAVIALVFAALSGTYAYNDAKQHKSNELGGLQTKHEARLVEEFIEKEDWKVEDGAITKKISVVNLGRSAEGYSEVFARIQLKEFMEIGGITYVETTKRYMIDTDGQFVIYQTEAAAIAATSATGEFAGHAYAQLTDAVTGKSGWFIETKDKDPNGQMGKYVVTSYYIGTAEKVINPGPDRAPGTNHHGPTSLECAYTVHTWDGNELATREYVEWILNDPDIITVTQWLDPAGPYKGAYVDKWIIDDRNNSGWVYWGRPLDPDGDSTALFMKAVQLIKQPEGSFYYVVHTDMQAVSYDELGEWGDVGEQLKQNKPWASWNSAPPTQVIVGQTVNSPTVTVGPPGAAQSPLTWTSSNPSVASVDQNGVVTGVREGGPVTITVTAPNGAKARYPINVITANISATGITVSPKTQQIAIGSTFTPTITFIPAGSTGTITWSSANNGTATVNSSGVITGVAAGTVRITATLSGTSATDYIDVTVTSGTVLPVNPGPFTPGYTGDPNTSDGWYGKVYWPDRADTERNELYHNGSFHLEDIITDGNFAGVTVTANESKYAGTFSIGTDKHGKQSIIYTYIPTSAELTSWAAGNPPGSHINYTTTVTLTRGAQTATVTLNLFYWGSLMVA